MKYLLSCLVPVISSVSVAAQVTLSGFVKESTSLEHLPGAIIKVANADKFVVSNEYGYYSISLPEGSYTFDVHFPGYESMAYTIQLTRSGTYDFMIGHKEELEGAEIVGSTRKADEIRMGTHQLKISDIKAVPTLLGEKDVFKVIKLLPGVQKGQEGSSGFNVRGGGTDQNLIILDDAVVYNASHLFGFFSTFNGDALKGVELIKGGYPARYGERLSSVLNITMKEGNKDHYTGEVGIGLLSSRVTLEGPIVKNKASFLVSGRRTYFDALMQPFMIAAENVSGGYYFYDLNAKVNYQLNDRNSVYLSGYFGRDKFYMRDEVFSSADNSMRMRFGWGNATGTLRWNHIFNPKLFTNLTVNYSNYNMAVNIREKSNNTSYMLNLLSAIDDIGAKYDLTYYWKPSQTIRVGYKATRHLFRPNAVTVQDNGVSDTSFSNNSSKYISWEHNLYVDDEWQVSRNLAFNLGVRGSAFTSGKKTYLNVEPRFSARYLINDLTSVKASYTIMNQYMHLLSSTGISLPTDLWVPATDLVAPQRASQYSLGMFRDILNPNITIGVEGYYKTMDNIITYKEGASFMELDDPFDPDPDKESRWEDKVVSGMGRSYGAELMIQKHKGRFTGWLSYTWSKTQFKFDGVNKGEWFYPRFDRRHDLNLVGFYELTPAIRLNALFTIATGNPVSLPQHEITSATFLPSNGNISKAYNSSKVLYSDRNDFRTEVYHRMDVGIQFIKEKKRGTRTWEISCYNIYNRKNPFFYTLGYDQRSAETNVYKYTIFPLIPSFSYSFKFK